jgi:transcriptional regulator with XRE-family HTH domain
MSSLTTELLEVSLRDASAADPPGRHVLVSGKQLKAARVLAGLSQQQLATETGRSLRTITGWEAMSGKPTASLKSVQRIEAALHRYGVALYATPAGEYGVEKASTPK